MGIALLHLYVSITLVSAVRREGEKKGLNARKDGRGAMQLTIHASWKLTYLEGRCRVSSSGCSC
uniref:Secreted protein n=1 Tax=Setaria viridis TaxID=4556 RepID=A0A4U6TJ56_SETVI|nr:hypothetical protein SEVIR_8G244820v2 [Setaria viridis]